MKEINNKKFNKRIIKNLDNLKENVKNDFNKINSCFDKKYILGGFVRDSILQVLYEYNFPLNDLDISIESKDFDFKIKNFPKNKFSRFGGLKLEYSNFEIDVFDLENIFFLKENPCIKKNLENVLKSCDLTTSALAYDLAENKIYSFRAIEDIYKKEINVSNDNGEIVPTLCRLILHSDKMNFKIGKTGINYIKKNYSPEKDKEIKDFLEYKNIPHLFSLVKKYLN